ncbi:TIGR00366 family protein [Aquella oligotrophica]|uniref:TIGR00366 family protein n=1 Tax=Aquella oligotrophica TaxID=2067065 RepID=A0A2I7N854_9NEIS|nr:TIGR00366 family protein [Aquella oligotrophica]AUR52644.1 TIGR00366 family protein [Aquella oligotrophica]
MDSLVRIFTTLVRRYLPDPLVFAMLLTIIVFIMGATLTNTRSFEMISIWGNGFWNLLAFTMQMVMVVVTGHALASAPQIRKLLTTLASLTKTPAQGVALVTLIGAIACIINWGFGLIVGAMLAREVARKQPKSDYPLLIASAYIAFLTWHGGFSGSIPLLAATAGNPLEKTIGLIPISQTIFTPMNYFITGSLLIILPILTAKMLPKESDRKMINPELLEADNTVIQKKIDKNSSPALKIEESKVLSIIIALTGISYLIEYFYTKGFKIDINCVNIIFLVSGLLLHGSPMAYARAIANGTKSTAGILIQFPFYAGIQAMLDHSGLGAIITEWFIQIANVKTFPLWAFLSSAVINFAVPSGGGHWVVQGPFIMSAAQKIGADMGHAVMAIAYGEAWMNMAQPFWALPALAIAGLGARDIMGYCIISLLFSGFIFVAGLMFF